MAIAARQARRYGIYVCETQEQADDHVQNVAAMLESTAFAGHYPASASRLLNKYGSSRGWRRNRLRTQGGFTLDAIGLDTAARGAKIDEDRPDLFVFDDLDGELDTLAAVEKKKTVVTKKLIPAGAVDLAVLGCQNLVHADSLFAQLADGRADFLANRIVSGPHPALRDLEYEQRDGKFVITAGEPTWAGQSLERCQAILSDIGLSSFLTECQHEVEETQGGLFGHVEFQHCNWDEVPDLVRIAVWVDPAVTDTDGSDSYGIQADGLASDGTIYRLYSWEDRTSPEDALRRAVLKGLELKVDHVGIETDQGGDVWRPAYHFTCDRLVKDGTLPAGTRFPALAWQKAGSGHGPKVHRASQMLADYERGRFIHVRGTHRVLERALKRFPLRKPFDLTDAAYWGWWDLTRPADETKVHQQPVDLSAWYGAPERRLKRGLPGFGKTSRNGG